MSSWPPASVRSRRQDLADLIGTLQKVDPKEGDLTAALSRYTVVRSAGYVEAVRDDVADLFVSHVSLDLITNRIRSGLRDGQGVRPGQLVPFVRTFHPAWGQELEDFLNDDSGPRIRSSDLGALVHARKKIAHGDGDKVGPTEALRWSATAQEVGGWLIKRFDPQRDFYNPVSATP
ncbi:HEPN domain-containing protein [Clavibacter sp. Sh2141]|uniref:HEPN domain-containing protein n=1 Tax=Clavibacter sp. Sh2141 TaxID=3395374 RepID=UPI0039BC4E32